MPIPSDEGIPSLGDLLGDAGGEDNRRGHIGTGRSVWSVSFIWLNQTNQIDQMNQTDQILERYKQARHDDSTTL
jgi:hypothetical protein